MFDWISLNSIALSIIGGLLGALVKFLETYRAEKGLRFKWRLSAGQTVLVSFAGLVLIFGGATVWRYWDAVTTYQDTLYYVGWLVITMVAGMFVQVLSANYRLGRPLFDVTASQLVYPLLFALVVFYPVWAIGASAPRNLFSFYAAFLNGFFWETVVSNARLPTPPVEDPKTGAAKAG